MKQSFFARMFGQRLRTANPCGVAAPRLRRLRCLAKQVTSDIRRQPRSENVSGAFFVDHTCIDCDTCRWMSPSVFARVGDKSAVTRQPESDVERQASLQALLSCPTSSIHIKKLEKGELKDVHATFPLPVAHSMDIFCNGFAAESSFGATSYIIKSARGNVLVDCPRFVPTLVKHFDEMGGIQYIFLTHIDDIGDHAKWAKHYQATRIIHEGDVNHQTSDCETQLVGEGPWSVGENGDRNEMEILHTPGHTRGSITLWHKPSKTMFTGDHFAYSARIGSLSIFPRYNDHSVSVQLVNVRQLLDYDFLHVLPGHGRRISFENLAERDAQIHAFLDGQFV